VVDLGINNAVENYLEALETEQPDILGMSALLTTTMPYMKVVIDTMKEQGIRDDYIVLVGGAPLNEEFGGHRRRRLLPGRRRGRGNGQGIHRARKHNQMAATAFARQGAELRFFLALAALLVAIVISMLAQRHVLRAHTAPFWARAQKNRFVGEQDLTRYVELPAATPRLRLGLWLVIGFAYGMLAIGWSDRVFPWLEPPSPTLDPATLGALEGGVILPLLLGCALIALIYGTVALSVYAIHITAMNYPAVSAVLKFAAVVEAVWEDRKEAKTGQTTAPAPAAKVTDGDPAVVQSMLDLIPEAWKAMTPRTGILPVESGMTPRQIVDIINTFVRPLVVILILSLVCLSLYLDTLEAGRSWPEEIAAAHDYWIVVLGALCSAVVAAVYLPALSRLSLYAEAADDLPKSGADPGWRIERGTEAEQGTRVIVKRSSPGRCGSSCIPATSRAGSTSC
jgi:hypothetical protein